MVRSDLVMTRDGIEEDLPFVFASWLKGLRFGNSWFEVIPSDLYYEEYHRVIAKILAAPLVTLKIACLKDDPEVILGYAVSAPNVTHWVFVKKAWRNIGIGAMLLPEPRGVVTHLTNTGLSLLRKRPSLKFNPFAI